MKKFRIILGFLSTFVFGIFGTNTAMANSFTIPMYVIVDRVPQDPIQFEYAPICNMSAIGNNTECYDISGGFRGPINTETVNSFCGYIASKDISKIAPISLDCVTLSVCKADAKTVYLQPCGSSNCSSQEDTPICDETTGCYDTLYYWYNREDQSLSGWYTGETCTSGNKITQLNPENLPKLTGYRFLGYFHSGSHMQDIFTSNATIAKDHIEIFHDGTFNTGKNPYKDEMFNPDDSVTLVPQWAKECASKENGCKLDFVTTERSPEIKIEYSCDDGAQYDPSSAKCIKNNVTVTCSDADESVDGVGFYYNAGDTVNVAEVINIMNDKCIDDADKAKYETTEFEIFGMPNEDLIASCTSEGDCTMPELPAGNSSYDFYQSATKSKLYTMTLTCDGKSQLTSKQIIYGENIYNKIKDAICETSDNTRFDGWAYENGKKIDSTSKMPSNDITLYALYADTYTLTFDPNGGKFPENMFNSDNCTKSNDGKYTCVIANGDKMPSLREYPTRSGNLFAGFYDDEQNKYYDFDKTSVVTQYNHNLSIILYARWQGVDFPAECKNCDFNGVIEISDNKPTLTITCNKDHYVVPATDGPQATEGEFKGTYNGKTVSMEPYCTPATYSIGYFVPGGSGAYAADGNIKSYTYNLESVTNIGANIGPNEVVFEGWTVECADGENTCNYKKETPSRDIILPAGTYGDLKLSAGNIYFPRDIICNLTNVKDNPTVSIVNHIAYCSASCADGFNNGSGGDTITVSGTTKELSGECVINEYDITYKSKDGVNDIYAAYIPDTWAKTCSQNTETNLNATLIDILKQEGKKFIGWQIAGDTDGKVYTKIPADKCNAPLTLKPAYIDIYTINLNPNIPADTTGTNGTEKIYFTGKYTVDNTVMYSAIYNDSYASGSITQITMPTAKGYQLNQGYYIDGCFDYTTDRVYITNASGDLTEEFAICLLNSNDFSNINNTGLDWTAFYTSVYDYTNKGCINLSYQQTSTKRKWFVTDTSNNRTELGEDDTIFTGKDCENTEEGYTFYGMYSESDTQKIYWVDQYGKITDYARELNNDVPGRLYSDITNKYTATFAQGNGYEIDLNYGPGTIGNLHYVNDNDAVTVTYTYDANNPTAIAMPLLKSQSDNEEYYYFGWKEELGNGDYGPCQWPVKIPARSTGNKKYVGCYFNKNQVCPHNSTTVDNVKPSLDAPNPTGGIGFKCTFGCKYGYKFGCETGNEYGCDTDETSAIITIDSKYFNKTDGKPITCTAKAWDLSFDLNRNSGKTGQTTNEVRVPAPITTTTTRVTYGQPVPGLINYTAPTSFGYTLAGWRNIDYSPTEDIYTANGDVATAGGIWDVDVYSNTATISAYWEPNKYTINFNKNCPLGTTCSYNGNSTAPMKPQTLTYNVAFCIKPEEGDENYDAIGYTFRGWSLDKDDVKVLYVKEDCTTEWSDIIVNNDNVNEKEITLYAVYEPDTYTVTFDDDYSDNAPKTYYQKYATGWCGDNKCSTTVTYFDAPTRDGYTFNGYGIKNADGTISDNNIKFINEGGKIVLSKNNTLTTADITLYAKWTPNTYNITIIGNDGTVSPESVIATYDAKTDISGLVASRTGYTFNGLYDSKSGGRKYFDNNGAATTEWKDTENKTLYAQWTAKEYSVSFNAAPGNLRAPDGNELTDGISGEKMTYDAALPGINFTAYLDGHKFIGWYYNDEQYYNEKNEPVYDKWQVDEEVILVARYTPYNASTIDFKLNDGTLVGYSEKTCVVDTETWELPTAKRTGYTFDGWLLDGKSVTHVEKGTCEEGAKLTYIAQWTANKFKISFDTNGGDVDQRKPVTATYDSKMPTLDTPAPTRTGYTFAGWYNAKIGGIKYYDANGESARKCDITENTTLYAHWTANEYTITINWDNGTTDETIHLTYETEWDKPSIEPRTKEGYTFDGILDKDNNVIVDSKGELTKDYTVFSTNTTITAKWTPIEFTVTFDANGGTGDSYTQDFKYKVSQALKPNQFTRDGYLFQGWAKDSTSGIVKYEDKVDGSDVMTPTTDNYTITLYAVWKPIEYTIAFDANDGDGYKDSIPATYGKPNKITKPNFTRTGYEFLGLATTKDATEIDYGTSHFGKDHVYNLTIDNGATVTLYAVWKAKTYTAQYNCNDGTFPEESGIEYGAEYKLQSVDFCKRTGYTFTGWSIGGVTYAASKTITWTFDSPNSTTEVLAQWTPNKYKLSYVCNDDENNNNTQEVVFDQQVIMASPTCTKKGYRFDGWYDEEGKRFESNLAWKTAEDKILYAHWEKTDDTVIHYMVSESNGETLSDTYPEYRSCNVLTERTLPSAIKVGHRFEGWCVNSESCEKAIRKFAVGECNYANDADGDGGEIRLYPKFEIKKYAVNGSCGVSGGAGFTGTMAYNETFEIPGSSVCNNNPGYTLKGWKYEQNGTIYEAGYKFTLPLESDPTSVEFMAQWDRTEFIIKYDINGGTGTAPNDVRCTYGVYDTSCLAPSYGEMRNGTKYFVGWAKAADALNADYAAKNDLSTVTTKDEITLYAVWRDCPSITTPNATVNNIATDKDNLCQYSVTCADDYYNPTVNNVDNISVTATCTACPAYSSRYGDATECTCDNGYSKNESYDRCEANVYDIDYNDLNGGSCKSENCMPEKYTYGKGATVGELVKTGYIFNGWCEGSVDTCDTPKKEFTISATDTLRKELSASWSPIEYTIDFAPNGATGTIDSMTLQYDEPGTLPSVSASNLLVKVGHSFAGWSGSDGNQYTDEASVLNLTTTDEATITMTAQWTPCNSGVDGDCNCGDDYHPVEGICKSCYTKCSSLSGTYTEGNIYTCGQSVGSEETSCYRYLKDSDVPNSLTVSGLKEYMNKEQSFDADYSLTCKAGYYPDGTECSKCPAGYYCPAGTGEMTCPNGKSSLAGAKSKEDCYTPVDEGGCVEFDDANNECTKYLYCNPGWELIGDDCNRCENKDGVLTYLEGCQVETCRPGYHADGNSCEPDSIDCTGDIEYAIKATKTWNENAEDYDECKVSKCESDYHIEKNACISNVQDCQTDYGSGTKTWKDNEEWGDCKENKCNDGYELGTGGCEQCSNAANVLEWAQGCDIKTCMYHGERYVIEDNRCVDICPENGYSDITGIRIWIGNKCKTTCNVGYKEW